VLPTGSPAAPARILNAPRTIERDLPPRPSDVLWQLEQARVAERLGDEARALEAYRFVAAPWRHADAELQPFVEEARRALERMRAEHWRSSAHHQSCRYRYSRS
jgi:hypothetical protein